MIQLRILLAVLLPALFGELYGAAHRRWVVQFFGCACQRGFNANVFSFIVHAAAALGATVLLFQAAARLPLRPRMNAASLGLILITVTTFYFWQQSRVA